METLDRICAALAGGSGRALLRDAMGPILASVALVGALVMLGGGR